MDHLWTLGGLSYEDGQWRVTKVDEVSKQRFDDLHYDSLFISRLAQQQEFGRVLDAVARWERALEQVKEELTTERLLSTETRNALGLDLIAIARAADRLEQTLLDEVEAATEAPWSAVRAFTEIRHRIRAMPNHLLTHELARQVEANGVELVLVDGVVFFAGAPRQSARNTAAGLLGSLHWLVAAHIAVFHYRFEKVADEIESAAAKIPEGTPCLISYSVGHDREFAGPINLIDLPLGEIDALRRFFRDSRAARGPEDAVRAAVALTQASLRPQLRIAGVDVAAGMVSSGATTGINQPPTARMELDLDLLGSTPVEYWGETRYSLEQGGVDRELFAGVVQQASIDGRVASLDCEGAVELSEHNARGLLAANVNRGELVESIILQAGLPPDIIPISERSAEKPQEVFEVLVPIRGIKLDEPVTVGPVAVVPAERGGSALEGFELEEEIAVELAREFRNATSYALAQVTKASLHEAEDAGWAVVEVAIAWLVTRERYGLARLPDGRAQPFSRQEAVRAPQLGDIVLVRGATTGRQWLRSRGGHLPLDRTLDPSSAVMAPALPAELAPTERQALLSLRRAAAETTAETRLQALWEAVEFYVARTRVPKLFSDDDLQRLRESFPDDLDEPQSKALANAIDGLNGAPVLVRLDRRLRQDGVPMSDDERRLLFDKLRRARNDTAHGRVVRDPPTREELNRGIALVARMLVYKISRLAT